MINIILYTKNGQLANRLLQLCSFITFADQCNVKIWYPGFEDYAYLFEEYHKTIIPTYPQTNNYLPLTIVKPCRRLTFNLIYYIVRIVDKLGLKESHFHKIVNINENDNSNRLNQEFLNTLSNKKFIFIENWAFAPDYYSKESLENVLNNTKFLPSYYVEANELIEEIRQKDEAIRIVGVHVRRGDYKEFEDGRYFYPISSYLGWMKQVKNLLGKDVTFILSSNEDLKSAEEIVNCDLVIKHAQGHLITDLITLSKCDFIIAPPSTYSMWASFKGKVPLQMIRSSNHLLELEKFQVFAPGQKHK
ncbi:MAG: alpha-1,2-fucosyltransferase [Cyclobacteriaceae bacterium]